MKLQSYLVVLVATFLMEFCGSFPIPLHQHRLIMTNYDLSPMNNPYLLYRHFLKDKLAVCNDGTSAGYYIRRNDSSTSWVVYLEGGQYCHNERSCAERLNQSNLYSLMSSNQWREFKQGDGILNPDEWRNPLFWNANHVYVPYCSSDMWTGNVTQKTKYGTSLHFRGAYIIRSVIKHLMQNGLASASQIMISGSSAGAIGVLQNIDAISSLVSNMVSSERGAAATSNISIRGLVDSGWFLDSGNAINCGDVTDPNECHPLLIFKAGAEYWHSVLAPSCVSSKSTSSRHKCFLGDEVFPTIRTPVFVFQWIYDSAQILADNKALEMNPGLFFKNQRNHKYMMNLGKRLRSSLINSKVHGVFAPSCIGHSALGITNLGTKALSKITIHGKSLNEALRCWIESLSPRIKSEAETTTVQRDEKQQKQPLEHHQHQHPQPQQSQHSQQSQQPQHPQQSHQQCATRLIESCSYFNCHDHCPQLTNPFTGQTMKLPSRMIKPYTSGQMTEDMSPPHNHRDQQMEWPSDQARINLELLSKLLGDLMKGRRK